MIIIATHKLWEYLDIEMACDIAREHSTQPMIAAEVMKDHAIVMAVQKILQSSVFHYTLVLNKRINLH